MKYLNTLPLVEGLSAWRDARIVPAAPSVLIDMLLEGRVDVALASVIDAGRHADRVAMLPVGMIGCDGPTMTVRLFSRVQIERLTRIGADTDSHTSVVLLRVLLARLHGVRPEIVPFDAAHAPSGAGSDDLDALLLIGDKVVSSPPPERAFPHQLDLGEAWKRLTGLPFVYAVWMCRSGEAERPAVSAACEALDRARRHNALRLDWLIERHASQSGWPAEPARTYLGGLLRYRVDERARDGMAEFFRAARQAGALPADGPDPRWAGEHPERCAG